jgi:hypothetical protein
LKSPARPSFMSQEGFRLWFSSDEFAMAPMPPPVRTSKDPAEDPERLVFDYFLQASINRLKSLKDLNFIRNSHFCKIHTMFSYCLKRNVHY